MLSKIKIMSVDYIDRIESCCEHDDREAYIELEQNDFKICGPDVSEVHRIRNYWNRMFHRC